MKDEKTNKKLRKNKIERSLLTLIVITLMLSSILAGSIVYENNTKKISPKVKFFSKSGLEKVSG